MYFSLCTSHCTCIYMKVIDVSLPSRNIPTGYNGIHKVYLNHVTT